MALLPRCREGLWDVEMVWSLSYRDIYINNIINFSRFKIKKQHTCAHCWSLSPCCHPCCCCCTATSSSCNESDSGGTGRIECVKTVRWSSFGAEKVVVPLLSDMALLPRRREGLWDVEMVWSSSYHDIYIQLFALVCSYYKSTQVWRIVLPESCNTDFSTTITSIDKRFVAPWPHHLRAASLPFRYLVLQYLTSR